MVEALPLLLLLKTTDLLRRSKPSLLERPLSKFSKQLPTESMPPRNKLRRPPLLKVPKLLLEHSRPLRKLRKRVLTRYQKPKLKRLMLKRTPRNQRRLKLKRRRRSSRPLRKIQLRMPELKLLNFMEIQKESWRRPRSREKKLKRPLRLQNKKINKPKLHSRVSKVKLQAL